MKRCPTCKMDFADAAKFCKLCGGAVIESVSAPLVAPARCPSCNTEALPDSKFCERCAFDFQQTPAVTVSPVVQPTIAAAPSGERTMQIETPAIINVPSVNTPASGVHSLDASCRICGATVKAGLRFCETCGAAVNVFDEAYSPVKRNLMPVLGAVAALLLVGLIVVVGVAVYRNASGDGGADSTRATAAPEISLEQRLEDAIARNNIISPPGANAREFYQQFRESGAPPSVLARFERRLMPLLTTRPQQMLDALATVPGPRDASPEEWEEAHRMLAWASEMRPDDRALAARAGYCAGRAAYLRDMTDQALESWRRAMEQDESWALPANGIGLIYNERREYATARQYLQTAINRDPSWAVPYNNYGTSYYYERNYDEAERYYRQAVERAPEWPRPHAWLGEIAMQREDYYNAVRELETALSLNETNPEARNFDPARIRVRLETARQRLAQPTYP